MFDTLRFIQLDHGVRPHSKFLTEYLKNSPSCWSNFAKMGDEESFFLINVNAISTMVNFYLGQKQAETYVSIQCFAGPIFVRF